MGGAHASWELNVPPTLLETDELQEIAMATNKPKDNARRGAVKKRTQLKTEVMGKET